MNPNYTEHRFPQIKPHPFSKVRKKRSLCMERVGGGKEEEADAHEQLTDKISCCRYSSHERLPRPLSFSVNFSSMSQKSDYQPLMRLHTHILMNFGIPTAACRMENLYHLCLTFQNMVSCCMQTLWPTRRTVLTYIYASFYLELSIKPELNSKLVPPHAEAGLLAQGIDIHNFQPMSEAELKSKAPR